MGFGKALAAAAAFATLASAARNNVAMYWGQGTGQLRLSHFCQNSDADIIPVAFMDYFPADANGWGGTNFGNQCWGYDTVYSAPGYHGVNNPAKNKLLAHCANLAQDIQFCQSVGKKILLSLGGGLNTYTLTGAADGNNFAEFLWKSFGPVDQAWIAAGGPRPFDPLPGTLGGPTIVDGFDFDIEFPSSDNAAGYIALIKKLRGYFPAGSKYLITGAPQCVVNDVAMDEMINKVQFDIIWVQFYNTNGCSLRDWTNANPNYNQNGIENTNSGFSYDKWYNRLQQGASKNAKLMIGTLGSKLAGGSTFYLDQYELGAVIKAYHCKPNFGGVMIWEATYADNNLVDGVNPFQTYVKAILGSMPICPGDPTSTSSTVSSTTTSASSTSTSSSTSSTQVATTSSSSSSSSSSSIVSTTTSSSSSSSSTVASSTTEALSTTTTSSSTSSSSTLASSTESSSTTITSSSSSSSSSSSTLASTTTEALSTTTTAASTTSAVPTCAASWSYVGCVTDGVARTLEITGVIPGGPNAMTNEACQAACADAGYTFAGTEYSAQCYCGNEFANGGAIDPLGDLSCDMPCSGDESSKCGGPYRLSVYQLKSSCSSSSTSITSSATSTSSDILTTSTTAAQTTSTSSSETSSTTVASSTSTSEALTTTSSTDISSSTETSSTSSATSTTSFDVSTTTDISATSTAVATTSSTETSSTSSATSTSSDVSSTTDISATSTSATATSTSSSDISSSTDVSSTSSAASTTSTDVSTTTDISSTSSIQATSTSSKVQTTTSATITSSTSESSSSSSSTSSTVSESTTSAVSSSESSTSVTAPLTTGPSTTPTISVTAPYGNSSIPLSTTVYPTLTSTIITTSVYTVTSCAPTVTACTKGAVTTETITSYTTYCPGAVTTPAPISTSTAAPVTDYTTSTVFTTIVYTVTACPSTVPTCRQGEKTTYVTTQTKFLYTTVCPVVASPTSTIPAAPVVVVTSVPVVPTPAAPAPVNPSSAPESYTTLSSTKTAIIYVTVPASKSSTTTAPVVLETHYVIPTPQGQTSVTPVKPSGTGAITPVGTGAITKPSGPVFTGAASRVGGSVLAVAVAGLVALMM